MAQLRHLSRAPITEALVDVRASATTSLDTLRDVLGSVLSDRFPKLVEIREFEAQLKLASGQEPVSTGRDKGIHGYRVQSSGGEEIAQFRRDGFTYNRLRPYTSGAEVLATALDLWATYVRCALPELVSRVALRYINRLELSASRLEELGAFLTSPPSVPVGSVGTLNNHLMRAISSAPESATSVIFTQAVERGIQVDTAAVILDIDAFRAGSFRTDADSLRPMLDGLRTLKNAVFFGSITEETVNLYA